MLNVWQVECDKGHSYTQADASTTGPEQYGACGSKRIRVIQHKEVKNTLFVRDAEQEGGR